MTAGRLIKHVLTLIASPVSWEPHSGGSHSFSVPFPHYLSFSTKVGVGDTRGVGSAGPPMWWMSDSSQGIVSLAPGPSCFHCPLRWEKPYHFPIATIWRMTASPQDFRWFDSWYFPKFLHTLYITKMPTKLCDNSCNFSCFYLSKFPVFFYCK